MEWRTEVGQRENATTSELTAFLELKARALQPSQGEKLSKLLRGETPRRFPKRAFQVIERKKEQPSPSKPRDEKQKKTKNAWYVKEIIVCGNAPN